MSQSQLSRNHHTIPEFYQKGFCDPKSRLNIWRYEKGSEKIVHPRIKQESVIQDYYSVTDDDGRLNDQIERELLAKSESAALLTIMKMRKQQPLTENDRVNFSVFVALMHLRTPLTRGMVNRVYLALAQKRMETYASDPERFAAETARMEADGDIIPGLNIEEFRKEVLNDATRDGFHNRWYIENEFSLGVFGSTLPISECINRMNWRVVEAVGANKYVASDAPVVISRQEDTQVIFGIGPANPDAMLSFPVTKNLALLGDYSLPRKVHYMNGDSELVNAINDRTIIWADKYVYAHEKSNSRWEQVQKHASVPRQYMFDRILNYIENKNESNCTGFSRDAEI